MKQFIHTHKKALAAAAVCLVLALTLAAGSWAALSAPRQQPEAPAERDYPGLNIEQIGLRYDSQSPTQDGAAGEDNGDGGQAPSQDPQQPDTPPEDAPLPNDQTTEEQPDPNGQDPQPEEGDGDKKDEEGPVDEDKKDQQPQGPQIATDLHNGTISQDELENDMFSFKAMAVGGDEDTYVRVRVNGKWISGSGDNYMTKLTLGRNEITILLKRGTEIFGQVTRVIQYQATKASEEDPEKGSDPPTIRTNLSGDTVTLTNRNLTFTVWANDGEGNPIHQNHITVKLDGKEVKYSTGSGANGLEYNLFLDAGSIGDQTEHTVTIVAWDDRGNSTYRSYKIIYKVRDSGEKIGTATVRVDLSVLGLGIVDVPVDCDIFQDVPASYAVTEVLKSLGYEITYDGSLDSGFYLTRISRPLSFKYAEIPEELRHLLDLDGLSVSRPTGWKNSVGEFDYTTGSGWMYSINGSYPGRGLSDYFLSDGDTLTLRFTLAYGKDIGGGTGGASGALQKYCGKWVDGVYTPNHTYQNGKCAVCGAVDPSHAHEETETVTKAATCTEAGEKSYTCSICGQTHTEVIPAAGHHYENGVCTGCGQADPAITPDPDPEPEPDPEPTPEPEPVPGGEETQNENDENAA